MEEIKRNDPKRQQNSVLPNSPIYQETLNRHPATGLVSLNESIKLLNQAPTSRIVENATVLEVWPPVGELKTKYTLPHLNMKDDKYFEDFLLKIRDPIHDEGSKVNPEDYLIELEKLDNDQKPSSFFDGKKYTPEQSIALKQYYECVGTHSTFAPKASSGLFSSPPAPGTKVRIEYFQEPYISAGHTIAGLYEKMYDDDFFEEGKKEIRDLLQKYRQKYLQAVSTAKNIIQMITQNVPASNQQNSSVQGNTGQSIAPGPGSIHIYENISKKNEEQKYDYFANFVPQNGGTFKTNLGEKNIVSIRKSTSTRANQGMGTYDDIFFLVWKDKQGKKRVTEYPGNTEPTAYYLDKKNTVGTPLEKLEHLSRLRPGYMIYTLIVTQELNSKGKPKYGGKYLRMKSGTYGVTEKDLNDDGFFEENSINNKGGTSMLFHPGGPTTPYSAGCQTMNGGIFAKFIADLTSDSADPGDIGYTLTDEATLYDPETTQSLSPEEPIEGTSQNPSEQPETTLAVQNTAQ